MLSHRWVYSLFTAVAAAVVSCAPALAIEGEAVSGVPFGVASVTLRGSDVGSIEQQRVLIYERDGRALYPVVSSEGIGRLLERIVGSPTNQPTSAVTILFVFHGEQPLHLTVYTPTPTEVTLTPRKLPPRAEQGLMTRWWRDYSAAARQRLDEGDHPPLVDTYLQAMLSQRLGLQPPLLDRRAQQAGQESNTTQRSLELLAGLEKTRIDTLRATMQGRFNFSEPADRPVPSDVRWTPHTFPDLPKDVAIEPIAAHVPQDCFYIRFGKFSNYLWFTDLLEDYGGDIASMVTLRSYASPMSTRTQAQLGLEKNELARTFGPKLIRDVALIGRDTYTQQGAAIGILFQAQPDGSDLLGDDIRKQREKALAAAAGGTEEVLKIAGHDVSFASTKDNRLRSFWATDGDYHLVTTSRVMVEQFFAAGKGQGSLAATDEFRYARTTMPLDRDDTIFLYFSQSFFQGLLSPQYQIETHRRLQSLIDLEVLQMAKWAAAAEGLSDDSNAGLIEAALLPQGFGQRPDGSQPALGKNEMLDSIRGARGVFAPVTDIQLTGVTATELDRFNSLATMYEQQWKQLDPLMIGIRRFKLPDQERMERVVIDGNLAPLSEGKFGWIASMVGPPTRQMIMPAANDIVSVQAVVRGGAGGLNAPPHHMFLGIQDLPPAGAVQGGTGGLLQTLQLIRTVPGYLGTWPSAGYLDMLPLGLGGGPPDQFGFSSLPFGLWRRQGAGYSVLSFDPAMLAEVTPQLRVVEAENDAQFRLHVGDLSQAKFASWVNQMYYQRGLTASVGNVKLLNALNQQLGVPMADARKQAEYLIDGKLVDPLRGEYQLTKDDLGGQFWHSTSWPAAGAPPPKEYQAPILDWFRGADAHLTKYGDRVVAHAEIDMLRKEREEKGSSLSLPLFNLFGGSQKAVKPAEVQPEELPPALPKAPAPGPNTRRRDF